MASRTHRRQSAKAYTLTEAAANLGRSTDDLRRASRKGFLSLYQPSHWQSAGYEPHVAACELERFASMVGVRLTNSRARVAP